MKYVAPGTRRNPEHVIFVRHGPRPKVLPPFDQLFPKWSGREDAPSFDLASPMPNKEGLQNTKVMLKEPSDQSQDSSENGLERAALVKNNRDLNGRRHTEEAATASSTVRKHGICHLGLEVGHSQIRHLTPPVRVEATSLQDAKPKTSQYMSIHTLIQWCDCTVNPAMGCDGCELFTTHDRLIKTIRTFLKEAGVKSGTAVDKVLQSQMRTLTVTDVYHSRRRIAASLLQADDPAAQPQRKQVEALARTMADEFRCYAAILHLRHAKDVNKPDKKTNPGYARIFEEVTQFRGRMVHTAKLRDLRGTVRPEKPWLDGSRRLIFVSDMGDLLSKAIPFEYIRDEVIANVTSAEGTRHIWLWLSKRPSRMARFSEWLEAQGMSWPDNLMAMTSVTSTETVGRVDQLKKVRCRLRGLSVEPLWNAVRLPLEGIDWTIVGGESGAGARAFDLSWARDLQEQCLESGTAFFFKQVGSRPKDWGVNLRLADKHGGTWEEWPIDLRVRELPSNFVE